jgi:hypothetical protein
MKSRFEQKKTSTGRIITVRKNISLRHWTIICSSGIYKTYQMTGEEFSASENWTGNDWNQFLKSGNEYYPIKN